MAANRLKARTDLAIVELNNEAVIYDRRTGHLHHLNPTAYVVFRCLDGAETVNEIARDIAEVIDLPSAQLDKEVRAMVREFRQAGLLEGGISVTGRRRQARGDGHQGQPHHQHAHQGDAPPEQALAQLAVDEDAPEPDT